MNDRQTKNSSLILFTDPPQDPSTAMDRDRELLAQYGKGFQTVIRLYQWKYPAITLGKIQDRSSIDFEKAAHDGIEITVRPTGGRHIYHQGDFCFSIIVPSKAESFWGQTVAQRQIRIGAIVSNLLRTIGVPASMARECSPQSVRNHQRSSCFSLAVNHELIAQNRKIAGIAQLISTQGGLIQGSIPLTDEYLNIVNYEPFSDQEKMIRLETLRTASSSMSRLFPNQIITFDKIETAFTTTLNDLFSE